MRKRASKEKSELFPVHENREKLWTLGRIGVLYLAVGEAVEADQLHVVHGDIGRRSPGLLALKGVLDQEAV